jgi:hypothetical protein
METQGVTYSPAPDWRLHRGVAPRQSPHGGRVTDVVPKPGEAKGLARKILDQAF